MKKLLFAVFAVCLLTAWSTNDLKKEGRPFVVMMEGAQEAPGPGILMGVVWPIYGSTRVRVLLNMNWKWKTLVPMLPVHISIGHLQVHPVVLLCL